MPIRMNLGPLGCGKTLNLTWRALKAFADGKKVYMNYPVKFDHVPISKPSDIIRLPQDCYVGIDEAQIWFPSLMSPKHPAYEAIGAMFFMARRAGWEIDMTTQRFKNVNARVRFICDIIQCPYPFPPSHYSEPRIFEVDYWDYHTDELLGTHYLEGASVWDLYDTKGRIYGWEEYMDTLEERLRGRSLADYYTPSIGRRMTEKIGAT